MTRVKICGITNLGDLEAAVDAGADYIGIVREPTSPRYVENPVPFIEAACGKVAVIGVYGEFRFDGYVQFFDSIQTISPRVSDITGGYVRVFRTGETDVDNIVAEADGPILLDAYHPDGYGGTGTVADWDQAAETVLRCEHPVFLAGGLSPSNVGDAIRKVRPFAVDVSSGVELAPGKKGRDLVRDFVQAARNV
ncbi:MAG: phosphoribosylanthranilate isomerase [Armatimonadota bacterium]|nr:phosphoribosylanthranilate isomerase [Armatimonadota bacterium]